MWSGGKQSHRGDVRTELGLKSVLLGFGMDSDNIHSPDEHYGLFNYYKGIETIPPFFRYYAEIMGK